MPDAAAESGILRAWADGSLAPDEAFERLFVEYGATVRGWLAIRTDAATADDLFQDVWAIFCRRWREWRPAADVDAADARPVLSFLFRTCHLVLLAHRRTSRNRAEQPLDEIPPPALDGQGAATRLVQVGECLSAARQCCSDEERAVLAAKLAGVPAREIARTLQITEAAVDHRYRSALSRIRERLSGAFLPAGGSHPLRTPGHHHD